MARVKDINIEDVSEEIKSIYWDFTTNYGLFANQAKVFAHRPIIFKYMMSMLLVIAKNPIIEKRYLEIVIVAVSAINKCDYCIALHAQNLISIGLSKQTVENILDKDCYDLNELDLLVRDYAVQITRDHIKVSDHQFQKLRHYFSEEQMVELRFRITLCTFFNKFNDVIQLEMENDPTLTTLTETKI